MPIFSSGSNSCGQLSNKTTHDIHKFTQVSPLTPTAIACGSNHSLIILNGTVFGCGSNTSYQLGVPAPIIYTEFVKLMVHGNDIYCGWESSFVIQGHRVFAVGDGKYGQLGIKSTQIWTIIPLENIDKISCGLRHTLFKVGASVYGCGDNKYKALGTINPQDTHTIFKLRIDDVIDISCGQFHSVILAVHGVYVTGKNGYGQALTMTDKFVDFTKITIPTSLTPLSISSAWSSIAIICKDVFLLFGRSDKGQCTSNLLKSGIQEVRIEGACGLKCGSEHSIGFSKDAVFVWGWNEHGNLGLGHCDNISDPVSLRLGEVVAVGVGAGHSLISVKPVD